MSTQSLCTLSCVFKFPSRRFNAKWKHLGDVLKVRLQAQTGWEDAQRSRPLGTCSGLQRPQLTSTVV